MKKKNFPILIGATLIAISIVSSRFTSAPCFVTGMLTGAGLVLQLIGLLPEEKYQSLRQFKKKLLS